MRFASSLSDSEISCLVCDGYAYTCINPSGYHQLYVTLKEAGRNPQLRDRDNLTLVVKEETVTTYYLEQK